MSESSGAYFPAGRVKNAAQNFLDKEQTRIAKEREDLIQGFLTRTQHPSLSDIFFTKPIHTREQAIEKLKVRDEYDASSPWNTPTIWNSPLRERASHLIRIANAVLESYPSEPENQKVFVAADDSWLFS